MRSPRAMGLSAEAIERFRSWLSEKGHPSTTQRAYTSDLRMLLQEAGESVDLLYLEEITMYWLNSTKEQVAPRTTIRRITSVRMFSRWAGNGEILTDYVRPTAAASVPHPIPEGVEGVLRMCEVARRPDQAVLVALGGLGGCRVSESLSMTCETVSVRERLLVVRGKGDKERFVPISSDLWTYLAPVYVAALGSPSPLVDYHERTAREIITNLAKKAGLSGTVSSHDLRATFATAVYDRTKDLRLVQELLGHASVTTTQVYTHVRMPAMRAAVEL
jgi:site-specific recombinase XerD